MRERGRGCTEQARETPFGETNPEPCSYLVLEDFRAIAGRGWVESTGAASYAAT